MRKEPSQASLQYFWRFEGCHFTTQWMLNEHTSKNESSPKALGFSCCTSICAQLKQQAGPVEESILT